MPQAAMIDIERLNNAKPLLEATHHSWEDWTVFNPSAVLLERSPVNDPIIRRLLEVTDLSHPDLADGVVAVHYRACPRNFFRFPPSFIGLAIFTPSLKLLKRYTRPVLTLGSDPQGYDFSAVEDPRVTRIGENFYMLYCGVSVQPGGGLRVEPCAAVSHDLLHWEKLGPVLGGVTAPNKDHVLFPEPIDGRYFMLHRPMSGRQSDYAIHLAMADSPVGMWHNCGPVFGARPLPQFQDCWNGAGSTPIPLGDRRYLIIYHHGERTAGGDRSYYTDAAIFNFQQFDPKNPAAILERRLEYLMVPETHYEKNSPVDLDHRMDCLFACGSYIYQDDLYLLYGGADAVVLGARMKLNDLLRALETADETEAVMA